MNIRTCMPLNGTIISIRMTFITSTHTLLALIPPSRTRTNTCTYHLPISTLTSPMSIIGISTDYPQAVAVWQ